MKFREQFIAYQKALAGKSRMMGTLMLASGICLAAAAPFLSYEVSKMQCYEKDALPNALGDDQRIVTDEEWNDLTERIENQEAQINDQKRVIKGLRSDSGSEDYIRQLEGEKEKLKTDLDELRVQKDSCAHEKDRVQRTNETLVAIRDSLILGKGDVARYLEQCNSEKRTIEEQSAQCAKDKKTVEDRLERLEEESAQCAKDKKTVEDQVERLEEQYAACQKRIKDWETRYNQLSNQSESACDKIRTELDQAKLDLDKWKTLAEACEERVSNIKVSGVLHYREYFNFQEDNFTIRPSDDKNRPYLFFHNDRDVTSRIKGRQYSYRHGSGKLVNITLNDVRDKGAVLTLTTR